MVCSKEEELQTAEAERRKTLRVAVGKVQYRPCLDASRSVSDKERP